MMIQQLVRTRTSERVPVHLPEIIEKSELLMRGKLTQKCVQLCYADFPEVPPVMADPSQITLVLVNLMLNAMQAMLKVKLDRRKITISLETRRSRIRRDLRPRPRAGHSRPEMMEKIFEKFYTTKEDGLGLGLAFSRAYIEQHGGKLWCQIRTRPRLRLPLHPARVPHAVMPAEAEESHAEICGRSEHQAPNL